MRRWTVLLAALALSACGVERAPERAMGSAIWVDQDSIPLESKDLQSLDAVGVRELFVPAAELGWSGATPDLRSAEEPIAPPRATPATLVIDGSWPGIEVDWDEVVPLLAGDLEGLRLAAEDRRLLPRGFHFDLDLETPEAVGRLAEFLQRLRKEFQQPLELSVRWPRETPAEKAWKSLAEAVDFVVAPLYGQRPGVPDDPLAWSLDDVAARLTELEELERPYLVEVVIAGSATIYSASGAPSHVLTLGDVQSLAWNRDLEAGYGVALDPGARQVYEFRARAETSAVLRRFEKGERIRVVATSTPILAAVLEALGTATAPSLRGTLFFRAPAGGEQFGLDLEQLLNAHRGGEALQPDLKLEVEVIHRGGSRWALNLSLRNESSEPTELSVLDANWVQIQLEDALVNWVRPGHFPRYQTFQTGSDGELYLTLRHADTVRLYVPMVQGRDELMAGPIEVRGWRDGEPKILMGGAFLTPFGGSLELAPERWAPPPTEEEATEPDGE